RRGAVDLVREQQVGEQRARPEVRVALARIEHRGADDVARHEIRSELHPAEADVDRGRERLHEERLGDARHAFEEAVARAEERRRVAKPSRMAASWPTTPRPTASRSAW